MVVHSALGTGNRDRSVGVDQDDMAEELGVDSVRLKNHRPKRHYVQNFDC